MPFRTISFPQLLKDHGVREDDCPVWGVRWTDAPQIATTTANNTYDTGAIEGCFATSDEAEAEYNDLLKQASNAPVVTKPKRGTRKGKTRADGAGDRQYTGPSTTVNAQEQTGPPPALPSETLLPQPELELQSVFREPTRSDGPGAGIPSHASSWELQDAPHNISALHAQMEVLAWQAPSTFSSLAGALDEVPNDRRLAPSTTTTYAPIMSGTTQPVFASTPARYTTYPPRQWTATTSGWELGPYNPTPASTTPAPPPPYTHLPPYVPASATVSSPQYTPGPFANRQQPTYASTPIPTVSTPYTPIHFGSAQHQDHAPQNAFQHQPFQPFNAHPTTNQAIAHMHTQPVFVSPAPRPAFEPAGFNLHGSLSAPASPPSVESPPWNVAGTPQDYSSPSTDGSVWTPVTPLTPSPVHWQRGGTVGVGSPGGAGQGGFTNYPFGQSDECYAAAPRVQHASEPYSGSSYRQQKVGHAEWPPYEHASYCASQDYYKSSE